MRATGAKKSSVAESAAAPRPAEARLMSRSAKAGRSEAGTVVMAKILREQRLERKKAGFVFV
jgi:hypothetical protein